VNCDQYEVDLCDVINVVTMTSKTRDNHVSGTRCAMMMIVIITIIITIMLITIAK